MPGRPGPTCSSVCQRSLRSYGQPHRDRLSQWRGQPGVTVASPEAVSADYLDNLAGLGRLTDVLVHKEVEHLATLFEFGKRELKLLIHTIEDSSVQDLIGRDGTGPLLRKYYLSDVGGEDHHEFVVFSTSVCQEGRQNITSVLGHVT